MVFLGSTVYNWVGAIRLSTSRQHAPSELRNIWLVWNKVPDGAFNKNTKLLCFKGIHICQNKWIEIINILPCSLWFLQNTHLWKCAINMAVPWCKKHINKTCCFCVCSSWSCDNLIHVYLIILLFFWRGGSYITFYHACLNGIKETFTGAYAAWVL